MKRVGSGLLLLFVGMGAIEKNITITAIAMCIAGMYLLATSVDKINSEKS